MTKLEKTITKSDSRMGSTYPISGICAKVGSYSYYFKERNGELAELLKSGPKFKFMQDMTDMFRITCIGEYFGLPDHSERYWVDPYFIDYGDVIRGTVHRLHIDEYLELEKPRKIKVETKTINTIIAQE